VDITKVHFKALTNAAIESYVKADQPYDCAGSFRSEGLGASLIESLENSDPTALIGLPMNWLTARLGELGYPGTS
jgi:septum formation protein